MSKLLYEIQTLEVNSFVLIFGRHYIKLIHPLGTAVTAELVISDLSSEDYLVQKLRDMRNYANQLADSRQFGGHVERST